MTTGVRQAFPALVAGAATLAGATLGLAVAWPRAVAAGVVVAVLVVLARRLPTAPADLPDEAEAIPRSSGFHPSALLADSLARAATDPSAERRVRPRLRALAESAAAGRGLTPHDLVSGGALSSSTLVWLGLDGQDDGQDDGQGPVGRGSARRPARPADLRRVVDEVCALAEGLESPR